MSETSPSAASQDLQAIIASARRLGVELDEGEALQWLTAMAAFDQDHNDLSIDERNGIFGHRVSLLDFSPQELARFREIGSLVEIPDRPGVVETALALSGSSAQSKIQSYPGDADYFERVNIRAADRQEACRILGEVMRDKALQRAKGPTYQLLEVKFGSYPADVQRGGRSYKAGAPISWYPEEIQSGQIEAQRMDGSPFPIRWEAAAQDPGWCKLDWVVADPNRRTLANASNMLDVTWEAPDGEITPLDGYLDPYFQEVYLDAEAIPIFSKLVEHVSADALENYVTALEQEVKKYLSHAPANYGKVAKRMYNIFRLTGRYEEAAFLRELFDEPTVILYQVWALIRTVEECCSPGSLIPIEVVLSQADKLILDVVDVLEGDQETEIVRRLLHLRDCLTRQEAHQELNAEVETAQAEVINLVNNFFYEKMSAVPAIKSYIEEML